MCTGSCDAFEKNKFLFKTKIIFFYYMYLKLANTNVYLLLLKMQRNNDSLNFRDTSALVLPKRRQTDIVQMLLREIGRVKELIKYYDSIPNGAGQLGSSILNELIHEAHSSLVNYDTVLIQKYYDLMLNCD